mmetsp:Transcript_88518/g.173100  ORF Transcript_88518/g.173100 Transcript_88518/m.173100 type:complete len:526 (+) Transcript_88518:60-1637(+)
MGGWVDRCPAHALAGRGRRSRLPHSLALGLVQDAEGLGAHEVAVALGLLHVFGGDVVHRRRRRVLLAVGREALRDTHARAIELTDDPLLLFGRSALRRREDEVRGPPERDRLLREAQRRHDLLEILLQELVRQGLELGLLRAVVRVDGPGTADGGDAALLRLLVDDADELVDDEVVTELALDDARAKALVHEHAPGRFAALKVLPDALGCPCSRLARPPIHAELDELSDGVLLGVVVVCLHELQHIAVLARGLTVLFAILAVLQLHDPNSLAGGTAVLLDHPRLELHRLLEARGELLGRVVGQGVGQADVQGGDLAQGILGPHKLHHIRRRPHLDARLAHLAHAVVELPLVAAIGLDLPRVAPDDDEIEAFADLEELVVLVVRVVDQLAAHAGIDHSVGEGNRIIPVAIAAFVRAAIRLGADVNLAQGALVLRLRGLRQEPLVVLGHERQSAHIHGAGRRRGRLAAAATAAAQRLLHLILRFGRELREGLLELLWGGLRQGLRRDALGAGSGAHGAGRCGGGKGA